MIPTLEAYREILDRRSEVIMDGDRAHYLQLVLTGDLKEADHVAAEQVFASIPYED